MTNRKIGLYRVLKILELGFEERYFTADDAFKHAFPDEASPEHNVHHRHLRSMVERGFLTSFTSPALPPGKKLYAITRQGAVFLSQHVAVPLEGLTPVRGNVTPITVNHYLAILRVRHALSRFPQVTWVPNRFVQRAFSKAGISKIPDALASVSLPDEHEYWGDVAVVAVEVELSWKDRARQQSDLARIYDSSGKHYSNCLIVGGNRSVVRSLQYALAKLAGKEVRLGRDKVIEVPEWFPKACSFWALDEIEHLTLQDLGDLPYIRINTGNYNSRFKASWRQAITSFLSE
ncbi:MAG: hypothetical protein ACE5HC_04040 [Candidatus Binatia bacterium]